MEKTRKQLMAETEQEINEKVAQYNIALKSNNFDEMQKLDGEIIDLESTFASQSAKIIYEECLIADNPMEALIKIHSHRVIKHKDDKDTKTRSVNNKMKQLNLLEFCKFSKDNTTTPLSMDWFYATCKLNQLLTMRMAEELGYSANDVANIEQTFAMKDLARKVNLGEKPTTNTQLAKAIQKCVDLLIGVNGFKVLNYDAKYLYALFAKKGKAQLSIQTAKSSTMCNLIMDIAYRLLTNGSYSVEYKKTETK